MTVAVIIGIVIDQMNNPGHEENDMPYTVINTLIVTDEATYVSFQEDSWKAAAEHAVDYAKNGLSSYIISDASPVFMRNVTTEGRMEQHTIGSLKRDLADGKIDS